MADTEFDVIVVGSGPGGYIAAIRARQLGLRAARRRARALGGICLNWGCIPTKALLRASEIQHLLRHLDAFGFRASDVRFDLGKLVARSRAVAKRLSGGVKHLMKKNKIPVFEGRGRLAGKGRVAVERKAAATVELERRTSCSRPAPARARCRGSSPMASGSGPTRRRCFRRASRARCWWWARARSGSSSRASTATSAPR